MWDVRYRLPLTAHCLPFTIYDFNVFNDLQQSDLERQEKMFSVREIIDIAIKIEKNGESYYREAMEKISSPDLKPVLLFLAEQEHEHIKWFEKLKVEIETAEMDQKVAEIGESMLQRLIGDQTFSLGDADLSELESVEKLIELAIELERDTIIFYQMLQGFIEDSETLKGLDGIIAEENRHIELLMEYVG